MARKQIKLPVTTNPHPKAATLIPEALPAFKGGGDNTDLICGGCSAVVAEGFRDMSFVAVDYQYIIVCPKCGAKNVGSATIVPADWKGKL